MILWKRAVPLFVLEEIGFVVFPGEDKHEIPEESN